MDKTGISAAEVDRALAELESGGLVMVRKSVKQTKAQQQKAKEAK